jgi:hypothetical protein
LTGQSGNARYKQRTKLIIGFSLSRDDKRQLE